MITADCDIVARSIITTIQFVVESWDDITRSAAIPIDIRCSLYRRIVHNRSVVAIVDITETTIFGTLKAISDAVHVWFCYILFPSKLCAVRDVDTAARSHFIAVFSRVAEQRDRVLSLIHIGTAAIGICTILHYRFEETRVGLVGRQRLILI